MKRFNSFYFSAVMLLCILPAGCSIALIKAPAAASSGRWEMVLEDLRTGPDQYNTANGYWEAAKGRKFIWATFRIINRLKTDQQFLLDKIILTAGGKRMRPFIIDMGGPVSMRANPEPVCAPGETISRKIIYVVPKSVMPEKITYEKTDITVRAGGS